MTFFDILKANPRLKFTSREINGHEGASYVDETGVEQWVVWRGERHVSAPGPWTPEQAHVAHTMLYGRKGK